MATLAIVNARHFTRVDYMEIRYWIDDLWCTIETQGRVGTRCSCQNCVPRGDPELFNARIPECDEVVKLYLQYPPTGRIKMAAILMRERKAQVARLMEKLKDVNELIDASQ
jgi:hypothetical protein